MITNCVFTESEILTCTRSF